MKPLPVRLRREIAIEPSTPEWILRILANDPDLLVRRIVGMNDSCPDYLRKYVQRMEQFRTRPKEPQTLSRAHLPDFLEGVCNDCGLPFAEKAWFPLSRECPSCGSFNVDYDEGWYE